MNIKAEINDEDAYLDMEMEKFSDLSSTEGFFWPQKYESIEEDEGSSLPSIKTFLPTNLKVCTREGSFIICFK